MKLGFPHIITPHCINRPWSWSAWGLRSTVSRLNSKGPWQIIGKNIRSTVIISALYGAHFLLHRPSPRTKSVALPLANRGTLVWFQIIGKCQFWIKEYRWLHQGGCMSIPTCPALHHWFPQFTWSVFVNSVTGHLCKGIGVQLMTQKNKRFLTTGGPEHQNGNM